MYVWLEIERTERQLERLRETIASELQSAR